MRIIEPDLMPQANGHYSQAIEHNSLLYISGQLPLDHKNNNLMPAGIRNQAELVLDKLDQILLTSGSNRNQVIQVRIYISDVHLWSEVNEVFAAFFGTHKPVRCIIPAGPLRYHALIELEAIAALND